MTVRSSTNGIATSPRSSKCWGYGTPDSGPTVRRSRRVRCRRGIGLHGSRRPSTVREAMWKGRRLSRPRIRARAHGIKISDFGQSKGDSDPGVRPGVTEPAVPSGGWHWANAREQPEAVVGFTVHAGDRFDTFRGPRARATLWPTATKTTATGATRSGIASRSAARGTPTPAPAGRLSKRKTGAAALGSRAAISAAAANVAKRKAKKAKKAKEAEGAGAAGAEAGRYG